MTEIENTVRRPRMSRRRGKRALVVLALCAVAAATTTAERATATSPTSSTSVVSSRAVSNTDLLGTWNITVTPSGGAVEYGTLTFKSDDSLKIVAPSFTADGIWQGSSTGWFTFSILHPLPPSTNELHGLLWGQESNGSFNTSGTFRLYGPSYNVLTAPKGVTVTATKQ